MPRRKIKFYAGEYYHVYNQGNNRQNIFFERENYLFFLRRVRKYLPPNGTIVVAYCLMPTHYHLMVGVKQTSEVSETSEVLGVSTGMMKLSVSYTKAINKRYQRSGVLFRGPFQAVHVDRNEYLLHLSRYIHLNPVTAGLVERPEDWEFSSYREYIGLRDGTLPEPEIVLSLFSMRNVISRDLRGFGNLGGLSAQNAYQEFVESYSKGDEEIIAHLLPD